MYSRSLASLFYLAAAILFATLISTASAAPADPGRTPGDVISENRNMACRMGGCFIKNGTDATDSSAVATADAAAATANSPDSTAAPSEPAANAGFSLHENSIILPAVMAGTSLLLLL